MNKFWNYGLTAALMGAMILTGCNMTNSQAGAGNIESTKDQGAAKGVSEGGSADKGAETRITGNGDSVLIEGIGAVTDGSDVTISAAGTYRLSGTISDGQILIEAGKEDEVRLILDGISLANSDSSAIYAAQSGLLTIELADGTQNSVTDGKEYVYANSADDEPNAAVFCKDDLVLTGNGSLTVTGNFDDGIRGKDTVTAESGTYVITAVNDGIKGRDSVEVEDGTFTITAGGDGIQSSNDTDEEKGYVTIAGGTFSIEAGKKGILAETLIEMNGGNLEVDSEDDAIHSNRDVTITAGTSTLSSGDDAIHGDNRVTVSGGEITVVKSYEGLEGLCIDVTGGTAAITSEDDGINAAGGKDGSGNAGKWGDGPFDTTEGAYIRISGGTVTVNASGDGIDSNGDFYMEGGNVIVEGPTDNGNGALDYSGAGTITGGTVLITGSSGMFQTFGEESAQPSLIVYYSENQSAETTVTVMDADGETFEEYTPSKEFSALLFSSPVLEDGKTYQVKTGEDTVEITVDGILGQSGTALNDGVFSKRRGGESGDNGQRPQMKPGGENGAGSRPSEGEGEGGRPWF